MRIQVNMGDELLKRIDHFCNVMGVSRSSFCSIAVGQYILSLENPLSIHDVEFAIMVSSILSKELQKRG